MTQATLLPLKAPIPQVGSADFLDAQPACKWAFALLWLFTVAVYARPEDIFPPLGRLHLTLVFGCCAGVAYVGTLIAGRAPRFLPAELWIVLLLTVWYIAGIPFSFWRGGSLQILLQVWVKTLVIFFLLTQTLLTLKRIRAVLWAIILSELAVTSFSILHSSEVAWVGGRMAGLSQGILGWNFLGIAVAITLPYISALFILRRSLLTSVLLAATSFSVLWMLVLTASRSGLLDVFVSLLLTIVLVVRGSARGKIIGVGISLALMVVLSLAPMVLWQRLRTVWDSSDVLTSEVAASAEESTEDHLAVLTRSIQYTLDNPVFGLGLGNFQVANGTELGRPSAWMGTHNTFTQISSEAGIPALLLFLGLLSTAMLNMKRAGATIPGDDNELEIRTLSRATLASLLSFVFAALFAHLAYEYYCFYPVAVAAGIQHTARHLAFDPQPGACQIKDALKAVEQ
jgi:O-antigen ligase